MVPAVVLLDAMGTLVQLERPWPHLVDALARRGVGIDEAAAREAMLAEIAYYREHHDEAGTSADLEVLRDACAAVLAESLGPAVVGDLPAAEMRSVMLEALVFRAYPEAPAVLAQLRDSGCRLIVVSNWDVSLLGVLEDTGLAGAVDGVVISAVEGCSKPDARIFGRALELAGVTAADAVHVGDSVEADVQGALAAGIAAVYVDRDGTAPAGIDGATVVRDLRGLLDL